VAALCGCHFYEFGSAKQGPRLASTVQGSGMASGVDAAGAFAVGSNLYISAAFLGRDRKLAEAADPNRFSTELSPDFEENRDQYLVTCLLQVNSRGQVFM